MLVGLITCVVIISVNSTTNPHALSEKPFVAHPSSVGDFKFAILTLCVPYFFSFTSFSLPTLYGHESGLSVQLLALLAIVSHESSLNGL